MYSNEGDRGDEPIYVVRDNAHDDLLTAIAALEADKARMDWLEAHAGITHYPDRPLVTIAAKWATDGLRAAVDVVLSSSSPTGP